MRQEHCEEVAHLLNTHHLNARSYHAGLHSSARSKVQNAFIEDQIQVVVATIAFGMGIDKANIRSVIHYHLPKSPEGWVQESGRAGRDGSHSLCQLLACGDDIIPLENFIQTKFIRYPNIEKLLCQIFNQNKKCSISPYQTRIQFDLSSSTLDVILAQLEVWGHLKFVTTSWRYIHAWPVTGKKIDLSRFSPKLRIALKHIFTLGRRYDMDNCEQDFSISANKVWQALEDLKNDSVIVHKTSGWIWHYKIKKSIQHEAVIQKLSHAIEKQKNIETDKLNAVENIVTSRACITNKLAQWFGEKVSQPCGMCSSCQKQSRPRSLPNSTPPEISNAHIKSIKEFLKNSNHKIRTNQQLTRFLCGIPTPFLRHYRLTNHKYFGLLTSHHYADVYSYACVLLNASD